MRLKHITFTGIDANTDINALREIQREFPLAEFGVLTSYHWHENGNRYLNPAFMSNLYAGNGELNLSLHICGSAAHYASVGLWQKIDEHLFGTLGIFKRIQLNVANRKNNPEYIWAPPSVEQEVIVQQRDGDNLTLYNTTRKIWNTCDIFSGKHSHVSVLLDASGGRGIDTELKVLPSNGKVGYAGGFNPDNVADKLSFLLEHVNTGEFWIDMESGVRTDDWFDLDKVVKVLGVCQQVIDEHQNI